MPTVRTKRIFRITKVFVCRKQYLPMTRLAPQTHSLPEQVVRLLIYLQRKVKVGRLRGQLFRKITNQRQTMIHSKRAILGQIQVQMPRSLKKVLIRSVAILATVIISPILRISSKLSRITKVKRYNGVNSLIRNV